MLARSSSSRKTRRARTFAVNVPRQLIRFYGDSMQMLRRTFGSLDDQLTRDQESSASR